MTAEEQQAIVDEAHRQGVRVACTAHAGVAVRQSIEAGCDSLELVTDIDEQSVRMVAERGDAGSLCMPTLTVGATGRRFWIATFPRA